MAVVHVRLACVMCSVKAAASDAVGRHLKGERRIGREAQGRADPGKAVNFLPPSVCDRELMRC